MTSKLLPSVQEIIDIYGKGSNQYRVRVLGEPESRATFHEHYISDPFLWRPIEKWHGSADGVGDLILAYNPAWRPQHPRVLELTVNSAGRNGWGYPNRGTLLKQQPTHFLVMPKLPE